MANNEVSSCPLCRNEKVKIFAVGDCAHPVCHLCSTKMRILCEQTYCAICRQDLPRVYFVSDLADTRSSIDQSRFIPIDETGDCGIYYPNKVEWIRRETEQLLRNFCPFCRSEYETLEVLRDHVRRHHHYFYCDLCVEHVNLFPHERKCYTRHDLVEHIRQGDRDDTSFKGHPLCRFCDDHFLDADHLFKHMRQEHYYCHLCTSNNVYYSTFKLLLDHYRSDHYLCEIGQCKDEQFINVFPSEIEFRAHQATQHSKSRAEARQLGTIPVEFQSSSLRDRRQQQRDTNHTEATSSDDHHTQGDSHSSRHERDEAHREANATVTVPSIDEFPTLGERSSTPQNISQRGAWSNDGMRGIYSNEDFPALANGTASASNTNVNQSRGMWRESQQQQPSSLMTTQSSTSKKATPSVKSVTNGAASMNMNEDFPALKSATNAKISAPVSMLSTWSNAKKAAKTTNSYAKAYQPQMRMNTSRLINDDEDDECMRRPMSTLTSSTTPMASSNITMISSSDLNATQTNDKQNTSQNQSIPKAHDFPALPKTKKTQNTNPVSSGVWATDGTNTTSKASTNQPKKKSATVSKKKFMEEVQAMPPVAALSSTHDFPTMGLNELGRRLLTEEKQPKAPNQVREEKSLVVSPPLASTNSEVDKSTTPSKKKKSPKATKTNDPIEKQPQVTTDKTPAKPATNQLSAAPAKAEESALPAPAPPPLPPPPPLVPSQPPPGFTVPLIVNPPPGFNLIPSSQAVQPSYIYLPSYPKEKDNFRAKLYDLFDGNMTLLVEYDRFCQAFSENSIGSKDFLKFTRELFEDKLEEYLLELIVLIPNIEQQNELYVIWKKEIQSTTSPTTSNWTKKTLGEKKTIYQCHLCRQIMFDTDTEEHNSHHTEFNTEFPSLPSAAVPLGRGKAKKNK